MILEKVGNVPFTMICPNGQSVHVEVDDAPGTINEPIMVIETETRGRIL